MKKSILSVMLLVFASINVFSENEEVKHWKSQGNFSLNFAQSHLSNWAGGGESALNGVGKIIYSLKYAKDNTKWNNSLDVALGYSILGEADPMKTDDRFEVNSMYGLKAKEQLFYSVAFSFKSQFMDGFDYSNDSTSPISRSFAPAYITLGLGMDWEPSPHFQINLAPVTGRLTIVSDQKLADQGAFGVEAATYEERQENGELVRVKISDGENVRFELGAKMIARAQVDIAPNVNLSGKLELFTDYLKNPQNIDIDLQTLLTMKINDWLNANIATHLIYDHDIKIMDKDGNIGPRTQFKEVFSLGLSFKL